MSYGTITDRAPCRGPGGGGAVRQGRNHRANTGKRGGDGGGRPPGEQGEFWRGLKPIEQKFRPGALPEAYIANAPTEDDRFYAPLSETVGTRPLWISPSQNR